jgi:hypothetical protein
LNKIFIYIYFYIEKTLKLIKNMNFRMVQTSKIQYISLVSYEKWFLS